MNSAGTPSSFRALDNALETWLRADDAIPRARTRIERGVAMLEQLHARGAVYRLSEIELLLESPLRVLLVEEGIWSPGEALDRLVVVDFAARARGLRDLAPLLHDECLRRALDMASRPGWGDDTRWEIDEELVQTLAARVGSVEQHEGAPEGTTVTGVEPSVTEPVRTADAVSDMLANILFRAQATGRDLWIEPWFGRLLRYVEDDNLWPEHLALVAEIARDRDNPHSAELRRALLASGHELWAESWFRSVFAAEERKEYLLRLVAELESNTVPWEDRFKGLLQIAERLQGPRRTMVMRRAVAHLEARGGRNDPFYHVRAARLADGQELADILAMVRSWLDDPSIETRLRAVAALMSWASPAEAISLARRALAWIAAGDAPWSEVEDVLSAIPVLAWAALKPVDWEPALNAGGKKWRCGDIRIVALPKLPEQARSLIEARGLPVLLEEPAHERLQTGARVVHALSPAGRAQLTVSVLALDAAAWRKTSHAVGPIAGALDDDDLERLCHILREPDPKEKWRAERGLAEAWAARGRLDRATAIVERIADDDERAKAQVAVAIAVGEMVALPPKLEPRAVYLTLDRTPHEMIQWTPQERGPAFADALAARLDEESAAWARLHVWAALWPALSAAMREELAPRIERAVEVVLAEDDRSDNSLCAIAMYLPERLLERIWVVRASVSAYRHALAPYEHRFCEFMLAGNYHHPSVLHFVQTLGGDEALFEHARWLAGIEAGSSGGDAGASK